MASVLVFPQDPGGTPNREVLIMALMNHFAAGGV